MNKQIKELAEQANGPNPFFGQLIGQMVLAGNDAVEKFAELIVKECIKIVQPEPYDGDAMTASLNVKVKQIKEHFGVE